MILLIYGLLVVAIITAFYHILAFQTYLSWVNFIKENNEIQRTISTASCNDYSYNFKIVYDEVILVPIDFIIKQYNKISINTSNKKNPIFYYEMQNGKKIYFYLSYRDYLEYRRYYSNLYDSNLLKQVVVDIMTKKEDIKK